MLSVVGFSSLDALSDATVPESIKRGNDFEMGRFTKGMTESEFLEDFKKIAEKNKLYKNFLGMGYYGTHLPTVIQRNLLENPGWYT